MRTGGRLNYQYITQECALSTKQNVGAAALCTFCGWTTHAILFTSSQGMASRLYFPLEVEAHS